MGDRRRVGGGLLTGLGQGIVDSANRKREDAINALALESAERREAARHQSAMDRDQARFDRESGLLSGIQVDRQGNTIGITRGGKTIELGFKARPTATELQRRDDDRGLSTDDDRLIDTIAKRYTSGKGSIEGEQTDWAAVEKALRKRKRNDLADLVAAEQAGGSGGVDVESPEYSEAQRLAEEWVDSQARLFGRDKTDFSDYGGNRAEALRAKTLEIYNQLTSGGTKSAGPGPGGDVNMPPGSGTQADPYKATTQSHVDWFRDNAPSGAIIEIEGSLYRK